LFKHHLQAVTSFVCHFFFARFPRESLLYAFSTLALEDPASGPPHFDYFHVSSMANKRPHFDVLQQTFTAISSDLPPTIKPSFPSVLPFLPIRLFFHLIAPLFRPVLRFDSSSLSGRENHVSRLEQIPESFPRIGRIFLVPVHLPALIQQADGSPFFGPAHSRAFLLFEAPGPFHVLCLTPKVAAIFFRVSSPDGPQAPTSIHPPSQLCYPCP